jgi:hypothetical protein
LLFSAFCFPPFKRFFLSEIPRNGGWFLEPHADLSEGGGEAGVHRQTLDREHGSDKRPQWSPRDDGRKKKRQEESGLRKEQQKDGQHEGEKERLQRQQQEEQQHDDEDDDGG